jgi:hypothetical protein
MQIGEEVTIGSGVLFANNHLIPKQADLNPVFA